MTLINPVPNNRSQSQSQSQSKSQSQTKRRSLSVSAVSRKSTEPADVELFSNKSDNPLFWTTGSGTGNSPTQPSSSTTLASSSANNSKSTNSALTAGERGRPVSRDSDHLTSTARSSRPRSSSRVDIHAATRSRGHSVSRHKYTPSSEKPISSTPLGNARATADTVHFSRRSSRSPSRPDLRRTSHPSSSADTSAHFQISSWDDYISTGSFSEAEERTIKAVYEQMKSIQGDNLGGDTSTSGIYETVRSEVRHAISDIHLDLETAIRRSNVAAIASPDVTDISPDLVKPGAVELVSEIRREYAKKLGECQERAKKLREDLAVEEHLGQELSRILKDPKTSSGRRSHIGRRTSSERKRMSKCLTDEALSYFDECVSISTFDSSDFSAAEDSAVDLVCTTQTSSLPQESPCISNSCGPEIFPIHKQLIDSSSSCTEATVDQAREGGSTRDWSRKFHFSSVEKPSENTEVMQQEGVRRNYYMIRNFEKEDTIIDKGEKATLDSAISFGRCKYYDTETAHGRESVLFDRILLKNRIHSGSLHLCAGDEGIAVSFLPFASLI